MKIFFDTNVYVAEALLGQSALKMLDATESASWRVYVSPTVLGEIEKVLVEYFGFSKKLAKLSSYRCRHRAFLVGEPTSKHVVPGDASDTPILRAAIVAGADYLVTNDNHLLALSPYESLRIVSMTEYMEIIREAGLID